MFHVWQGEQTRATLRATSNFSKCLSQSRILASILRFQEVTNYYRDLWDAILQSDCPVGFTRRQGELTRATFGQRHELPRRRSYILFLFTVQES